MNSKRKVVEAIHALEKAKVDEGHALNVYQEATEKVHKSSGELIRVLHHVYGDRASEGVIFAGRQYRVVNGGLETIDLQCDVLDWSECNE